MSFMREKKDAIGLVVVKAEVISVTCVKTALIFAATFVTKCVELVYKNFTTTDDTVSH